MRTLSQESFGQGANFSYRRLAVSKAPADFLRFSLVRPSAVIAISLVLGVCQLKVSAQDTVTLSPELSVSLAESYDNNVMLQNEGGQAKQDSMVTTVLPVVGAKLSGQGETDYSVGLRYAPDFTFFTDLSRESYLRQIGLFDLNVAHADFSVKASVKGQYTDGTTEPPNWGTTADGDQVPALGATEVRNRRRNMYFTSKVALQQEFDPVFVRGVFDARVWDFMTEDTFVPGMVIQNYYDRSDVNGGVDFGMKAFDLLESYIGYRYGHQNQEFRANSPSYSYANDYDRILFGVTGKPVRWLQLNGEIGPSFHFFNASSIPAGTHTRQNYLYFAASATFQIAADTTFKIAGGQHLLPASAGNGVFQNLTASGRLTHRFSSKWQVSAECEYINYDFDAAFERWDEVFMPSVRVEYAFNKHFSTAAWYAYNLGSNLLDIENGDKRDYNRQIIGIAFTATY